MQIITAISNIHQFRLKGAHTIISLHKFTHFGLFLNMIFNIVNISRYAVAVFLNLFEQTLKNNLCTPFKYDIRCASFCGVEFVVTKERREKRAQRESYLKGVQRLHFILYNIIYTIAYGP